MESTFDYVAEGIKLIDCDAHWTEPPDLWTSRAPAKYKDLVPHVVKLPNGADRWLIAGDKDYSKIGVCVIDNDWQKHMDGRATVTFDRQTPAGRYAPERLKYMDEYDIWAQILYPNAAGFNPAKLVQATKDIPGLELASISIYNDAAADLQKESGNRLFPQAMLPMTNRDEMLKEMRRVHEDLKLTGITVTDNLQAVGLPDYLDPYWEPFWEYLNAARLPLSFHIGGSAINISAGVWPTYKLLQEGDDFTVGNKQSLALGTILAEMSNAACIANFLYSDIFDRYPNIKLISTESGIGWIPYLLDAAEYQLDETILPKDRLGQRRPSEYWRDHWYAMFWFERFGPKHAIETLGVHNVMLETDFPHPTCLWPNHREHFNKVAADWDPDTRRRIFQENAVELFKLPMPVAAAR